MLEEQRGFLCLVGFSQLGCVAPLGEHCCVHPSAILLSSCCPSIGKELYPGLCCALMHLSPAGLSAGQPSAMRVSPKRSLTAVFAASFFLLLLLLHRASWQQQDFQVSPVLGESPPLCPTWASNPSSAPFLPHWDPNLWFCCLPWPCITPKLQLCLLTSLWPPPVHDLRRQMLPLGLHVSKAPDSDQSTFDSHPGRF